MFFPLLQLLNIKDLSNNSIDTKLNGIISNSKVVFKKKILFLKK